MSFEQIAWLPLCAGVTTVGLVLSFLAVRRRGWTAGLRLAAWSLLPTAAYLTGALGALWTIGATVVGFVTGLVLSPTVWAGVAVAGLSVLLFLVSGVLRGRALSKASGTRISGAEAAPAEGSRPKPATPADRVVASPKTQPLPTVQGKAAPKDDDFGDVEDILKRHGIS